MATDLIFRLIFHFFMTIGICILIHVIFSGFDSYEITVNEKSFKTSDFKTKSDGSIEFTADDGTIIRASDYEIRKLN